VTYTVPDKGTAQNDIQSILFEEDWKIISAGVAGTECVLVGCAVTAQGSPDMTVAVAKGAVLTNGVLKPVTAGNVTITTAHATNPRLDAVVVDSTGAKQVRAGTAAAAPKPPVLTANDVALAFVFVPANDTTISTDQIRSKRMLRTVGPITIFKETTNQATNTTASAVHLLNKAGSGVVIPNGLLVAGRSLRVRVWGNWLGNSGTPTVRFVVSYGAVTLFSDISGAITADADRKPFDINLVISAQASNDQALGGTMSVGLIAGITAPTTGRGDIWSTAMSVGSINGDGTADSDAADRTLEVTGTFSVSNASNEWVTHGSVVELI
jgi:hypothetical protein